MVSVRTWPRVGLAALLSACFYDEGKVDPSAADASTSTTTTSTTTTSPEPQTATLEPVVSASTADPSTTDVTSSSTTEDPTTAGGCVEQTWYLDADGDGYGLADATALACDQPRGYAMLSGDCAPADAAVSPGQPELCDGKDNDCDPLVDEYSPLNATCNGCRAAPWDPEARVFYLCGAPLDWTAARAACQARGPGHDLVVLHSAEEQAALVAAIDAVPEDAAAQWWLGLGDSEVEGSFGWVDGSPLDFTSWLMGEPNNLMEEDCVQYPPATPGAWNDLACAVAMPHVCEGPQ